MKVTIEEYNPEWKTLFEKEKEILSRALVEQGTIIEHIRSTSIVGLGAKPIIDILIGLQDFNIANLLIKKITTIGYAYNDKFEGSMFYRRFFTKEMNGVRTHHIHMVEINSEFWRRHLAFRNHLKSNPADRDRYYNLKKDLSKQEWKDENDYALAKSNFIKEIEHKIIATNP